MGIDTGCFTGCTLLYHVNRCVWVCKPPACSIRFFSNVLFSSGFDYDVRSHQPEPHWGAQQQVVFQLRLCVVRKPSTVCSTKAFSLSSHMTRLWCGSHRIKSSCSPVLFVRYRFPARCPVLEALLTGVRSAGACAARGIRRSQVPFITPFFMFPLVMTGD